MCRNIYKNEGTKKRLKFYHFNYVDESYNWVVYNIIVINSTMFILKLLFIYKQKYLSILLTDVL